MITRHTAIRIALILVLALLAAVCRRAAELPQKPTPPEGTVAKQTPQEAEAALLAAAERERQKYAGMTFEQFKASAHVYREPFEGGKYIVNGDTPIPAEKQLLEFFNTRVRQSVQTNIKAIIVANVGGVDLIWNGQMQGQLKYCVSRPAFGSHYDAVVREMAAATRAWEQVAAVKYQHDASQDEKCGPTNANVVFDVRPVNVNGEYLARAFFPNEPRADRNVLVDESSFQLDPTKKLQLVGILRHELGHTLGFRHEHTRPSSGPCFEDWDWREITDYDQMSVMHYPQCNGKGDWSLTLTDLDKNGAACLYGPAAGFTISPAMVNPRCRTPLAPPATGTAKHVVAGAQKVAAGAEKEYGPYNVAAGSLFEASIGGEGASGDPDLYVRFNRKPTTSLYNCRPFLAAAFESCSIEAPTRDDVAYVTVRGYTAGTYTFEAKFVPPR